MALLLVLILIIMVSAAGVFAAQSGALEIRSSGFTRQAAQTHYVAETGAIAAMTAISYQCGMYSTEMERQAGLTMTPAGLREPVPTYSFGLLDFNPTTSGGASRVAPFAGSIYQARSGAGPFLAGSFGPGLMEADFTTRVSRLYVATTPQFGWAQSGGPNWQPPVYVFLFEAQGYTRLTGANDYSGNSRGSEAARVIAQVPCL